MANHQQTRPRVLSGIQPTSGSFHLGNYVGAVKQWVALQEDNEAFYCVVDLHAITVEQPDPADLRERSLVSAAQLLAAGLDPERCSLFLQSHVPAHTQVSWVMECLTGFGEAARMTQFKDKSSRVGNDRVGVGLLTYPILQVADILVYQAQYVPVGEDQRQHIELTRDLAQRFNTRFGDTFVVPEAYILPSTAKILDLQDPTAKMSKSLPPAGTISLLDPVATTVKKIKRAVTDTGTDIRYDPIEKPGVSNLLTIFSAVTGQSVEQAEAAFAGQGYGQLKVAVADAVAALVEPLAARTAELMDDRAELGRILARGAERANEVAGESARRAYAAVGFVPPFTA